MSKLLPKLVIFDLDGTLVEFPREFLINEVQRILPLLGLPVVERPHLEHSFSSFDFFNFFEEQHREKHVESYWQEFDWDSYPSSIVYPFSLDVLSHITTLGVETSLATARATNEQELKQDLEHTGLLEFISSLAFRESRDLDWMDKRPQIERVLDLHEVRPHEAIMVGDIPADVISAREAGLAGSVAVLSGGIKEEVLAKTNPSAIIQDVSELPGILKKLLK